MNFVNKVVCITGAGSGLGRALALNLAHHKARLLIIDVHALGLQQTEREILQLDCDVHAVQANISDFEAMKAAAQAAIEKFGQIDLWINNAGISRELDPLSLTPKAFTEFLDINLLGTINGVCAALPSMLDRNTGHIVNIASGAGLIATAGWLPYAVSKFGVAGYSEGLHAALAKQGIGVSLVCPLWVDTPMNQSAKRQEKNNEASGQREKLVNALLAPFRKAPMSAQQAAERILRGVSRRRYLIYTHPWVKWLLVARALAPESFARAWARTNTLASPDPDNVPV